MPEYVKNSLPEYAQDNLPQHANDNLTEYAKDNLPGHNFVLVLGYFELLCIRAVNFPSFHHLPYLRIIAAVYIGSFY